MHNLHIFVCFCFFLPLDYFDSSDSEYEAQNLSLFVLATFFHQVYHHKMAQALDTSAKTNIYIYTLGMCVDFVVHEFLLVMISHFLVDMLLILRHIRLPNTFQMNLCKVLCGGLGSPVCRLWFQFHSCFSVEEACEENLFITFIYLLI